MSRVLLVEDQLNVRRSMALLLQQAGHSVLAAAAVDEARRMAEANPIDVVVTDVRVGEGSDGVTLLRDLRARDTDLEVVLITAFGTIADAVEAMKAGAYDYLTKPADPDRLLMTVQRAAERCALSREVRHLRAQMGGPEHIIAASAAMQRLLVTVSKLATTDSAVLITGESGTGKELIARALYEQSPRRDRRFVPINCGAIPEALLESELFGHRKGSFTGAVADKKGLLEEADGGVLFLDEIGEMPASMQVRLLRFLQSGEVRRVGDTRARQVDVRLVAATHRSLDQEVANGGFRLDFYYRINVVGLVVPPLRARIDDIPPLAGAFLRRTAARLRRPITGFTPGAMELLQAHGWPGNVRELENAIERAVNFADGPLLTEADLPVSITAHAPATPRPADEREQLVAALEGSRWNQTRAAVALGMSRTTLWRKMREHRIDG
jgi:two-component system response regulator AtoC